MGYGASYAYQTAKGAVFEKSVIKTKAELITAENVKEYKAMFILCMKIKSIHQKSAFLALMPQLFIRNSLTINELKA